MRTKLLGSQALGLCLLLGGCGGDDDGSAGGAASGARVSTQLSALAGPSADADKFRAGSARAGGLTSLKYQISSIMVCESLQLNGSGFNNPTGCLELYHRDHAGAAYELNGHWTPLAEAARATDDGYVDLLSTSSRSALASTTAITREHARSYNYGVINWSLPIKLTAALTMSDGSRLYTHDGTTRMETIGVDNFRSYFTAPATPLTQAPAEEAVVLLGNGGNWFRFQQPFVITPEDIESKREFLLDLVFNPDGIVKGFSDSQGQGQLSQRGAGGEHLHDITVPMLDLVPVPHLASEQVMRESYQGRVDVGADAFDLRLEVYYVQRGASSTIYGVDVKSLVNGSTAGIPPEVSKVSFVDEEADGTLTMSAHKHTRTIWGFRRVAGDSGTVQVSLSCASHSDRAAAEGGAAIVMDSCGGSSLNVDLRLTSRTEVRGAVSAGAGAGPMEDAGVDGAATAP